MRKKVYLLAFSVLLVLFVCACNTGQNGAAPTGAAGTGGTFATRIPKTAAPTDVPAPTRDPSLPPLTLVSIDAAVTVSSAWGGQPDRWSPDFLVDGDLGKVNDGWSSNVRRWVDNPEEAEEWAALDLGEVVRNITQVVLYPRSGAGGYFPVDYSIEISEDGENWISVYACEGNDSSERGDASPHTIELENPVDTRYIRVHGTKLTDVHAQSSDGPLMQLSEFEVYALKE